MHADALGAPDDEPRSVTLHWPAAEDAEGVVAYLLSVDDGVPTRVEAGVTEAAWEGVTFTEAHRFSVRAVDEAGNESESLSTDDALAPSFSPNARADVEPELPAATLRWTGAQDDVGVVAYSIVGDGEEIASVPAEVRSYRLEQWGQAERYEVAALDAAGHKTRLEVDARRVLAELALWDGAVTLRAAELMAQAESVGVATTAPASLRASHGGGSLGELRGSGSIPGAAPVRRVGGRVELGPLVEESGQGVFDPTVVARRLRARLRAIQVCYERELQTDPTLVGRVLVRLTVTERGDVEGARALENTTASAACAASVVNTVRRFRFNPGAQGGDVTLAYPLTFRSSTPGRADQPR